MARKKRLLKSADFHSFKVRLLRSNPNHTNSIVYNGIELSVLKDTLIESSEDFEKIKDMLPYLVIKHDKNVSETE